MYCACMYVFGDEQTTRICVGMPEDHKLEIRPAYRTLGTTIAISGPYSMFYLTLQYAKWYESTNSANNVD